MYGTMTVYLNYALKFKCQSLHGTSGWYPGMVKEEGESDSLVKVIATEQFQEGTYIDEPILIYDHV